MKTKTFKTITERLDLTPLEKKFIPIVQNVVGTVVTTVDAAGPLSQDFECTFGVVMTEWSAHFIMCKVTVTPKDETTIDALKTILARLEKFATYDDMPWRHANKWWLIGDGDDANAVYFEKGSFCIWLRGWTENPHC
jgi:hypothetical protein